MIEKSKYKNSFNAIHDMLIRARLEACDENNHKNIFVLLDKTEHLFQLFRDDDKTEEFVRQLVLIANQLSLYSPLQRFDGGALAECDFEDLTVEERDVLRKRTLEDSTEEDLVLLKKLMLKDLKSKHNDLNFPEE
ncbi:MAG: hypothetical protein ACYTE0_06320 [Planctomycetota bacterium]|jgi:hypothetical protein